MSGERSIQEFVEETRFGRFHYVLVALCAAAVFMDGMDAQTLGYAAPALRASMQVSTGELGIAFSAGLIGLFGGSLLFGLLGDVIGRKRTILLCVAVLGICTMLTMTADTVTELCLWRLVSGFGLGGVGPNVYALASEYSSTRLRPIVIMVVATAFPLGSALGGIIAAGLITRFGWEAVFLFSGAVTLAQLPLLLKWLPDSLVQKVVRGDQAGAARIAARMNPASAEPLQLRSAFEGKQAVPLALLFRDSRTVMTLLFWSLYFCTMLANYFLTNWLPTLMHGTGRTVATSVLLTSLLQFGGTAGGVVVSFVMGRFNGPRTMAIVYALAAAAIAAIGLAGSSDLALGAAAFVAGFMLNGGQIGTITLASGYYPPVMRSTGLGWASGIGRAGAALGAWIGGVLVAAQLGYGAMFAIAALPAVVAAASAFSVGQVGRKLAQSVTRGARL